MRIRTVLMVVACGAMLSGCGFSPFVQPEANPVIEDQQGFFGTGDFTTFSTKPDRRMVLIRESQYGPLLCSEPPADVASSVAASFATAATAKVNDPTSQIDAQGGVQMSNALQTAIQALAERSQGLQFYRDGLYKLCENRLNGWIDNQTLVMESQKIRDAAVLLISTELMATGGKIPAPAQGAALTVDIKKLQELIQEQQKQIDAMSKSLAEAIQ